MLNMLPMLVEFGSRRPEISPKTTPRACFRYLSGFCPALRLGGSVLASLFSQRPPCGAGASCQHVSRRMGVAGFPATQAWASTLHLRRTLETLAREFDQATNTESTKPMLLEQRQRHGRETATQKIGVPHRAPLQYDPQDTVGLRSLAALASKCAQPEGGTRNATMKRLRWWQAASSEHWSWHPRAEAHRPAKT